MRKAKGFTLIELLVVIAIIALLLAILMPSLNMAKEHAKRLLCGKDLSSIGVAIAMYANQEDDYLPPPEYYKSVWYVRFFGHFDKSLVGPGNSTADERLESLLGMNNETPPEPYALNLAYLMRTDLIDRSLPELFYCTSNKKGDAINFLSYGGKYDWPNRPGADPASSQANRIHIPYSYVPQHRYKKMDSGNGSWGKYAAIAKKYSKMDPSRSVVMDILHVGAMSHASATYVGVNVLYGDGSVTFNRDNENVLDKNRLTNNTSDNLPWRAQLVGMERQ